MKWKGLITILLLMSSVSFAEEVYVEGDNLSGYVVVEEGSAEGFLEDRNGTEVFVEGDFQSGAVYDGLKFYDGIPTVDEDAFGQDSELLEEDAFGQELDYYDE